MQSITSSLPGPATPAPLAMPQAQAAAPAPPKHLLTLDSLTPAAMEAIFAYAHAAKRARPTITPSDHWLAGRTIALLFEKPSLRTRVSFEVGAREMGAETLYLSPQEVGLGKREAVRDVARVLSGYVAAVVIRAFDHATVEEFARYATIPVINGLTDAHHPCQGLTDLFTIVEQRGAPKGQTLAYIGDGNNVAHSLLQAAVKAGIHMRIATPPNYAPDPAIIAAAQREAQQTGASVTLLTDPQQAANGAHVLYTDVWTSMGAEGEQRLRQTVFAPYRIDDTLLALAAPDAIVLHPLPAHRGEEISDAALDGPHSRVFIQAENRLHVQKGILHALLA